MKLRVIWALLLALTLAGAAPAQQPELPYKKAGLTERQAAAYLLDRLAYGPRPGDVDRVVQMGLEKWVDQQLQGNQPDVPELTEKLSRMPALTMNAQQMVERYPPIVRVRQEAIAAGVVSKDDQGDNKKDYRQKLIRFGLDKGYRPGRELIAQMVAQKVLRAVYSPNQLDEVLTDFWFNHFNVSLTDNQCRLQILSYERDAIRPRVLGKFRDLLGATAKHPAMLLYLDNAQSTAAMEARTSLDDRMDDLPPQAKARARQRAEAAKKRQKRGINENYARELMELHTLGVDGGYTQKDVQEVARALTGWTVNPEAIGRKLRQLDKARKNGVVVIDGGFMFRSDAHDSGAKTILGQSFPAGRGIEDGEQVLDILANHPSTARFVTHKLACWFVQDNPPPALEKRLAATFQSTHGDIQAVMRTMIYSPEFWSAEARRSKVKSPFELAVSSLRALDADVTPSRDLYNWISKMGEPLYAYQAPTGFPDQSQNWVNTGLLLTRMNFGLSLASNQIPGVRFDLVRLNGGQKPANVNQALVAYTHLLLPERDADSVVELLTPKVNDPDFAQKIAAADKSPEPAPMDEDDTPRQPRPRSAGPIDPVAQVVGVILGSPEFQRQ